MDEVTTKANRLGVWRKEKTCWCVLGKVGLESIVLKERKERNPIRVGRGKLQRDQCRRHDIGRCSTV